MGRFRIDDPDIDVAALEAEVEAQIAAKTGKLYSEGDLEELRRATLQPRVGRQNMSHGVLEEMPQVRRKLRSVGPPPGPVATRMPDGAAAALHGDVECAPRADINPARDMYTSSSSGFKGRLLGGLRRLLRPLLRTSSNLEHVLVELVNEMRSQDQRLIEQLRAVRDNQEAQLRATADLLKDSLDQRIDHTADWVGEHVSDMTGQLEGRHETQLHLLHNLVYELSYARGDMDYLQDQISELNRHFEWLEARERTLEGLFMGGDDDERL